jgi:hypothetical protein
MVLEETEAHLCREILFFVLSEPIELDQNRRLGLRSSIVVTDHPFALVSLSPYQMARSRLIPCRARHFPRTSCSFDQEMVGWTEGRAGGAFLLPHSDESVPKKKCQHFRAP